MVCEGVGRKCSKELQQQEVFLNAEREGGGTKHFYPFRSGT